MKNNNQQPNNWQEVNLKDVCVFERGIEPGRNNYNTENKGQRFLRVSDLSGNRNDITFTEIETDKKANKDDILLTLDGSVGIVKKGMQGIFSSGIRKVYFKDKDKYSNDFLYFLLQCPEIQNIINSHAKGSTIKHASQSIEYMKVLMPKAKQEQKNIAEILSSVDENIEKTEEIILKTEELKKGLMQKFLTKGIGHTKFKKTKLGEIPEEWEVLKGEKISKLITKGASPKWQGFDYTNNGTLFITSENVRDGFLDLSVKKYLPLEFHNKLKNSQLKKNDILINIVGASIGRSSMFAFNVENANINQAVCLLRLKENISPKFIIQYLQYTKTIERLLNSQGGSARQNLSLTDIKNFEFTIPNLQEQKQIAEILSAVDDKINIYKQTKNKLTELKKGLTQDLLSGRVRV